MTIAYRTLQLILINQGFFGAHFNAGSGDPTRVRADLAGAVVNLGLANQYLMDRLSQCVIVDLSMGVFELVISPRFFRHRHFVVDVFGVDVVAVFELLVAFPCGAIGGFGLKLIF